MDLNERIDAFSKLGYWLHKDFLRNHESEISKAVLVNPWFTIDSIEKVIHIWAKQLTHKTLLSWLCRYNIKEKRKRDTVFVIMAGNIPLVGFHDFLTVLISGCNIVVKMSSNDNVLLSLIIKKLIKINNNFADRILIVDNITEKKIDAIIATGGNHSSNYFHYYFRDVKKIIRSNRTSLAILNGKETRDQLVSLADDVFSYFGLGCRNVSKLFLPKGFELDRLFDAFFSYRKVIDNRKYMNNYDYNKAVFLLGNNKFIENGFLILKEEVSLFSPVAVLYYEFYDNLNSVHEFIINNKDNLQCVISDSDISFGSAQNPNLWDYADGIDTMDFLSKI